MKAGGPHQRPSVGEVSTAWKKVLSATAPGLAERFPSDEQLVELLQARLEELVSLPAEHFNDDVRLGEAVRAAAFEKCGLACTAASGVRLGQDARAHSRKRLRTILWQAVMLAGPCIITSIWIPSCLCVRRCRCAERHPPNHAW